MKRPTTFTIWDDKSIRNWAYIPTFDAQQIIQEVDYRTDIYVEYERLCGMCLKQYRKHGGLDMVYLSESSILKNITRMARRRLADEGAGRIAMTDDQSARRVLARHIYEWCQAALDD